MDPPDRLEVILLNDSLKRRGWVPDAVVTCTWSYSGFSTTSKVTVKGQAKRITILDDTVTRTKASYPTMTIEYTDENTTIAPAIALAHASLEMDPPDRLEVILLNDSLKRRGWVPDADVRCKWSYFDGVKVETISIVQLLGQAKSIKVPDYTVRRGEYLLPKMTRYYTDDTSNVDNAMWYLQSLSPADRLVVDRPSDSSTGAMKRRYNASNGIVVCNWAYFDGATVYTQSKVAVTGGPNGGNESDTETAQNCSSQNKEDATCPVDVSGSSCSADSCNFETEPTTCQSDEQAGDPVNINNLEVTVAEVDLEIPGRGINYQLKRTYRSRINLPSAFGWNWEHNFDMRFVPHPQKANVVLLFNGAGRGDEYTIVGGEYIAPAYHFKKVIRESDGSLLLRNRNGTLVKFYALDGSPKAGRLSAMINRCGNRLTVPV
jgi:hypothetical protein